MKLKIILDKGPKDSRVLLWLLNYYMQENETAVQQNTNVTQWGNNTEKNTSTMFLIMFSLNYQTTNVDNPLKSYWEIKKKKGHSWYLCLLHCIFLSLLQLQLNALRGREIIQTLALWAKLQHRKGVYVHANTIKPAWNLVVHNLTESMVGNVLQESKTQNSLIFSSSSYNTLFVE